MPSPCFKHFHRCKVQFKLLLWAKNFIGEKDNNKLGVKLIAGRGGTVIEVVFI